MAIQTHGVTTDIILDEENFIGISSSSEGLNTGTIDRWIEDGAAHCNAILESKGIDQDGLTDNATRVVRSCIISFVVKKMYIKSGKSQESIDSKHMEFRDALAQINKMPEVLGDSQNTGAAYKSNIDTTEDVAYEMDTFKF